MSPKEDFSLIEWMECVDSTNKVAQTRFDELDNLSVIATNVQNNGRGQGDHKWHSNDYENLCFSLVLKFDKGFLDASMQILLTQITCLGICSVLRKTGLTPKIKWPNDIWISKRKICGILIENKVIDNCITGSIIGVGLNVNEVVFPADLPNPTSIKLETGETMDLHILLNEIHKEICLYRAMLDSDKGRIELKNEFERILFRLP